METAHMKYPNLLALTLLLAAGCLKTPAPVQPPLLTTTPRPMAVPENPALQAQKVFANLQLLYDAGTRYRKTANTFQADYADIVGPGKAIKEINPVAGEDYTGLKFFENHEVHVTLKDGRVLSYTPSVPTPPKPSTTPPQVVRPVSGPTPPPPPDG